MILVEESRVEQIYLVRPEFLNGAGRLFGGRLMEWIDETAAMVAMRHSQSSVVTASVDNLKFIHGAYLNDLIVLIGHLVYVGNTSMEVKVDTYVESLDGIRRQINRAYLMLVAVHEGKSVKVPRLIIETETEKAEWEAALKRKEIRIQRSEEGF
ncbi:MAG: acyl-CoA thioesterase [Clostridiales bacterium]|nr:acyl-CoA thioesterase [Clostridiales bacterium]